MDAAPHLADVLCTPWLPPYGGPINSADADADTNDYVPRAMLEPILEECTDDDDEESTASSVVTAPTTDDWYDGEPPATDADGGNGGVWSSESETGSVIRVDFSNGRMRARGEALASRVNVYELFSEIRTDPDTLSEREFACPVKRRRQNEFEDDEDDDDEMVRLRHPQRAMANEVEFKFRIDFADATDALCKR